MIKYFITSDVHSFYTELMTALNKAGFDIDNESHILVVLGDLFDRGSETIELYNFVRSLPDDRFVYIRGNHSDLLRTYVTDVLNGSRIGGHHISNGTVKTVDAFLNSLSQEDIKNLSLEEAINKAVVPVLDWMNEKCVNYFEIGNKFVCCHGYVPCIPKNEWPYDKYKSVAPLDWWNEDHVWKDAVWINGMSAWKQGCRIEGKTIICGHYTASWGHSHLHQDRKEWPEKNRKDWKRSFEPFVDDRIIAIDSCCVYSGFLNCIVIEEKNDKYEVII